MKYARNIFGIFGIFLTFFGILSLVFPYSTTLNKVYAQTNDPPVSDAGPDQTVDERDTVTLDGTNSSDPNNDTPLTYFWNQTVGPSVTLSDPSAAQLTFTAPPVDPDSTEVLTFELTVTDSQGLEDPTPDSVTITVNDVVEPPPPPPTPTEAIEELISDIQNLEGVSQGTKAKLIAPLERAHSLLTDDKPRNDPRACNRLDAFIDRVDNHERRSSLSVDQAADLRTQAENIRDMLGC